MYGLQLLGKIRWCSTDSQTGHLKELQKAQNKLLRFLNKSKISDKVPTSTILKNLIMCSVNQLNAKIKLTEMWKYVNLPAYANNNVKKMETETGLRTSRSVSSGKIIEGKSTRSLNSFINDSTRAWNQAPNAIKVCKSLLSAKKAIKSYIKTLPV